jgi:hypothetical protein
MRREQHSYGDEGVMGTHFVDDGHEDARRAIAHDGQRGVVQQRVDRPPARGRQRGHPSCLALVRVDDQAVVALAPRDRLLLLIGRAGHGRAS